MVLFKQARVTWKFKFEADVEVGEGTTDKDCSEDRICCSRMRCKSRKRSRNVSSCLCRYCAVLMRATELMDWKTRRKKRREEDKAKAEQLKEPRKSKPY